MDKQFEVGKEYYCSIEKVTVKVESILPEANGICFSGYEKGSFYESDDKGWFWFRLDLELNNLNEGKFTEL